MRSALVFVWAFLTAVCSPAQAFASETALVRAILRGDVSAAKASIDQINEPSETYPGMPPLFVALTPEVQNRMHPEDHGRLVRLLRRNSHQGYIVSDSYIAHLAAFGPAEEFETYLRYLVHWDEGKRGTKLFDHNFPLTTLQRGQDYYARYGRTGDGCPLLMQTFYAYLAAPENSVQLDEARRKFAFLLEPHRATLTYGADQAGSGSEPEMIDVQISDDDKKNAMDTLDFLKNLRAQTETAEEKAARLKLEAEDKAREERIAYERINHPESKYYAPIKADINKNCSIGLIANDPSKFMAGLPLHQISRPNLYIELARAGVHPELRRRRDDVIATMRRVERFDQQKFDSALNQFGDWYADRLEEERERLRRKAQARIAEQQRQDAQNRANMRAEQADEFGFGDFLASVVGGYLASSSTSPANSQADAIRRAEAILNRQRASKARTGSSSGQGNVGSLAIVAGRLEDPCKGSNGENYCPPKTTETRQFSDDYRYGVSGQAPTRGGGPVERTPCPSQFGCAIRND